MFGEAALRLCGAAAQLLGWRPAEFWTATPAELAACLGQQGEESVPPSRETLTNLLRRFPDEGGIGNG